MCSGEFSLKHALDKREFYGPLKQFTHALCLPHRPDSYDYTTDSVLFEVNRRLLMRTILHVGH